MGTLYELATDLKKLQEIEFEEINEQEQVEEIKEIIKYEIENKSSNMISLIRNIDSDIDVIDNEIERLQKMKKSKENKVNNIKKYIKICLEESGIKSVETPLGSMKIRNNAPKVIVDDLEKIDNKYILIETTTTLKVDKKAIKESIYNGETIEGCHLERGTSLTIK